MRHYQGLIRTIINQERENLEKAMRYWRHVEFHTNHPHLADFIDPMGMRVRYQFNAVKWVKND